MMVAASGGERNLNRHTSLHIEASKSYENHGVAADLQIRAEAPAKREEAEKWYAAGREFATLRLYFDGTRGGQETSFGQDAVNDSRANQQALRESQFHLLLHLRELYDQLQVSGKSIVEGQECYVLRLSKGTDDASEVRLFVSTTTGLVLKRESESEQRTYRKYVSLDGEMIPYETLIEDALGETLIKVRSARFNVAIPPSTFRAHR